MKNAGAKYTATKNLDIKQIAKMVRKDLKAALPGYKFSVRISRYSMGQSLGATLLSMPTDVELIDCAKNSNWLGINDHIAISGPMADAVNTAEGIIDAYNRKDIDMMSDCYNVRFSGRASVDFRLRQEAISARELANELADALDEEA